MKTLPISILLGLFAGFSLQAEQLTVNVKGFNDPTTFSITQSSDLNLRVIEQLAAPSSNQSTHILVEGLIPLEDGSQVYASPYRGINSTSGEDQDAGVLFLELPTSANLPEGTVSSPIVGVVQRTGAWSQFGLTTPSSVLGGATGPGDFGTSGIIDMALTVGADLFSGQAPYTVVDADTIELEAFTLVKDGTMSIDLSGATLVRDGMRFYGTLTNLSSGAAYDALLYSLELTGIPDVDGDGIPDISDPNITEGGLTVGEWQEIQIGWVYGTTSVWGLSTYMGYVYMANYPYIYHINLGWIYHMSKNGKDHLFYDSDIGWIIANEDFGGWYYYFQTEYANGAYAKFSDPQP